MRMSLTPRLSTTFSSRTPDYDNFKLKIIDFGFARSSKKNRK